MSQGWGVLVAKCDKSRSAKHLDRSVDRGGDVTAEPFREQPDIELRLTKTIVGRMLMNAEVPPARRVRWPISSSTCRPVRVPPCIPSR